MKRLKIIWNELQNQQYYKTSVMLGYLPKFKILKKQNFYTKEPVKILRIDLFGKVWFYHLTFRRLL